LPLDTTEVAVKPNWSAAATPVADDAVLHGARGVGALELDGQAAHAEPLRQPGTVEQRRAPSRASRDARDRRSAAPARSARDAARECRRAARAQDVEIVGELEETAALLALEPVAERMDGAAVDARPLGVR